MLPTPKNEHKRYVSGAKKIYRILTSFDFCSFNAVVITAQMDSIVCTETATQGDAVAHTATV